MQLKQVMQVPIIHVPDKVFLLLLENSIMLTEENEFIKLNKKYVKAETKNNSYLFI